MKLQVFKFDEKELRVFHDEDNIWFVASDLAKSLGYKDVSKCVSAHCKPRGTAKYPTPTTSGNQDLLYVDESNMYRLVMSSKLKDAEKFQDWVVEEVLPAIRKTGVYLVKKQLTPAQMFLQQAQMLVEMESQILEVKEEVREIKAKSISSPADYYAIAGYAALINKKIDVPTAAELGRKASSLCKTLGYTTGSMPDPRFGTVKLYPIDVLKTIFDEKNL